jgi:hypothetical protein
LLEDVLVGVAVADRVEERNEVGVALAADAPEFQAGWPFSGERVGVEEMLARPMRREVWGFLARQDGGELVGVADEADEDAAEALNKE